MKTTEDLWRQLSQFNTISGGEINVVKITAKFLLTPLSAATRELLQSRVVQWWWWWRWWPRHCRCAAGALLQTLQCCSHQPHAACSPPPQGHCTAPLSTHIQDWCHYASLQGIFTLCFTAGVFGPTAPQLVRLWCPRDTRCKEGTRATWQARRWHETLDSQIIFQTPDSECLRCKKVSIPSWSYKSWMEAGSGIRGSRRLSYDGMLDMHSQSM